VTKCKLARYRGLDSIFTVGSLLAAPFGFFVQDPPLPVLIP